MARKVPVALFCSLLLCGLLAAGCRRSETGADRRLSPWEQAAARGVDFRALGQEPGWLLEIREGEDMMFAGDYGQTRIFTAAPERTASAGGGLRYRGLGQDGELVVLIEPVPCQDVMSGERFPARVVVRWAGGELQGCGRDLRAGVR